MEVFPENLRGMMIIFFIIFFQQTAQKFLFLKFIMQQNVLDNEEGNCIFSPLSAALSLSLVTYGAKGGTKEMLTDLLIGTDAGFSIDEFLRWVLRIQRKIQVFKNLFSF
jgi:Serpin (serine protease inhibitor)